MTSQTYLALVVAFSLCWSPCLAAAKKQAKKSGLKAATPEQKRITSGQAHPPLSGEERRAAGLPAPDQLALATTEDIKNAGAVGPEVLKALKAHLSARKVKCQISASRKVGDYILLWVNFPEIRDGGTDVIYSVKEKRIVGTFLGGYRG